MTPEVSVVIPTYNAARFVRDTIDAVLSLAREVGVDIELIVVDDGSTDDTAAAVDALPVRLLSCEHRGVAAARNTGVAEATAPVVGMLDADDRWTSAIFTTLLPLVRGVDGPLIAKGRVRDVWPGEGLGPPYEVVCLGSGLYTAATFAAVGGFDESLPRMEDFEWFVRAYDRRIPQTRVPDTALHYLRRPDGLTGTAPQPDPVLARTSRMVLQRRQREGIESPPDGFPSFGEYLGVVPPEEERRAMVGRP